MYHRCALLADGSIECWGNDYHGQLGDGPTFSTASLVTVSGITQAIAVAAGGSHACALLRDGSVQCWGDNICGQLGDGTTTQRSRPVPVKGL
jgi:alpha-tubulin suppressor-like RCC1 family protein